LEVVGITLYLLPLALSGFRFQIASRLASPLATQVNSQTNIELMHY